MPHSGACLCGQTKIEVASTHDSQINCHCTDCQKTSGAAHSTNILPKQSDVKITGAVKQYDSIGGSGNTVSRLFCGSCGSAIGHKSVVFGEAMAIQTGNLPDFAKIPITVELFTKDRWTSIPAVPDAAQNLKMP
ncbi:Mss4-like protein [Amylocystis lapponica]|nr:Mss4-like protein [Amylocystis lapponica]